MWFKSAMLTGALFALLIIGGLNSAVAVDAMDSSPGATTPPSGSTPVATNPAAAEATAVTVPVPAATTPSTDPAPADPAFTPTSYYFPFYDNNAEWGFEHDVICITNLGSATDVDVYIGDPDTPVASFSLGGYYASDSHIEWESPATITDGPVKIVSRAGSFLLVTKKVIYKDSYDEMNAVNEASISSRFYFNWFDNDPAWGMNGNWLCVSNVGDKPTGVQVFVGDDPAPIQSFTLQPWQHVEWRPSAVITDGPMMVVSTDGQPLLSTQRVLYKDSFNEIRGVPEAALAGDKFFAWYDNDPAWGMLGDWILLANLGQASTWVDVYIGASTTPALSRQLSPGGHFEWQPAGTIVDGPVQITSREGQPILASQRVIYKDSFEQVASQRAEFLGSGCEFAWYDSRMESGIKGNWLLAGNLGTDGNMTFSVARTFFYNPLHGGEFFMAPYLTTAFYTSHEAVGGPVDVRRMTGGGSEVISQRLIYKNSFNELTPQRYYRTSTNTGPHPRPTPQQ